MKKIKYDSKDVKASIALGVFLSFLLIYPIFRSNDPFEQSVTLASSSTPTPTSFSTEVMHSAPFTGLSDAPSLDSAEQQVSQVSSPDMPTPPQDVVAKDLGIGSTLYISWKTPSDPSVVKFRVYRSLIEGVEGELVVEIAPSTRTYYYDQQVKNAQRYYYLVHSVNVLGRESQNADTVMGLSTDTTPPSPPSGVQLADIGEGQMKILWKNPFDADFSFVRIYRSTREGELGSMIQDRLVEESFVDVLTPGKKYYYTLTSVDQAGNESSKDVQALGEERNIFLPSPQ